jgi:hypothetical protein
MVRDEHHIYAVYIDMDMGERAVRVQDRIGDYLDPGLVRVGMGEAVPMNSSDGPIGMNRDECCERLENRTRVGSVRHDDATEQ